IREKHTFNKLLSLVKFDKVFNNVVKKNLDIKTNEFNMVGIISQNEVVLNFNLGELFSFVKVDGFSFEGVLKISEKFSPKKFSLLEKVKLIVFHKDNYFVFDRSHLFVNFSQWFFYYEVNINKILSLYDFYPDFYKLVKNSKNFNIKGFSKYLNVYENLGKILKGSNYLVFKKDFFISISDGDDVFLAFKDLSKTLGIKEHFEIISSIEFKSEKDIFNKTLVFWSDYIFQLENQLKGDYVFITSQSILKIPFKKVFVFYKFDKNLKLKELEKITKFSVFKDFVKEFVEEDLSLKMNFYESGKEILEFNFNSFETKNGNKNIADLVINFNSENIKDLSEILSYHKVFKDLAFLQVVLKDLQSVSLHLKAYNDNFYNSSKGGHLVFCLENSEIQWEYLLRFSTNFSGMLKIDKRLNMEFFKLDGDIFNYDKLNLGNTKILYEKDRFKFKLYLNNKFLNFLNLANIFYVGNYELEKKNNVSD
ncbi:MAG: hypothetical protein ACK4ZM_04020, partial [bacterium]